MLIVDIKINADKIATLRARRKNDVTFLQTMLEDSIPCEYEIEYEKESGEKVSFELKHDYQDKAEVLVSKAMAKAGELIRR